MHIFVNIVLQLKDIMQENILSRKNLILIRELVKTDFKLRYQGSVLGYLWAIIRPFLLFTILYVVFDVILHMGGDIDHYPVYLLTGTVLWSFFIECTNQGIQSILMRGDLLRKINFSKPIIVISATATAVINLLINLCVITVFCFINGIYPTLSWLLLPLFILELYIFSLGISFLLGAINVKFRDISSIWEVVSQALFYAIPIIYPISMVAARSVFAAKLLLLNPIAQIIQDVRYALITKQTITTWNFVDNVFLQIIPIFIVILFFLFGIWYFNKHSKKFAEEI